MKRIVPNFVFLTALFTTGIADAQESPHATAQARAIAPLIDEVTVAVLHVDLSRIQVKPLLKKAVHWFPEWKSEIEAAVPALSVPLEAMKAAGVTDAYAVVTLAGPLDADNLLFFAIPLPGQSNEKTVSQAIRQAAGDDSLRVERLHDALAIGTSDTLARLRDVRPDERPELQAAFEATEGTVAQAILLPPKHTRRVIEEIMPELPEAIGGGPSSVVTNGILWAVVDVELEPKVSITGVIQSRDKDSAERLRAKWVDVRRILVENEELRREIPHFGPLFDFLTPEVRDSRLALEVNEDSEAFTALIKAIRNELAR